MGLNSNYFICILIMSVCGVHSVEVIKVATFVSKASPWGQVLEVWATAVSKKSNGRLGIQCFYSSTQGDEGDFVRKMNIGQLDGALLTAAGLGRIYTPILALQMPGLFKTWSNLYTARQAMDSEFQQGMNNAGFTFFGWSDFGAAHLLSKGFDVKTPNDMKGKKLYLDMNNPIERALYQVIGNFTPVSVSLSDVLPQLNMGSINIIMTPPLVAEQLQWSSKFDRINMNVNFFVTGGLVIATKRLNALPIELRRILLDTGTVATNALTKRILDDDNSAFFRLQNSMQAVTLNTNELSQWNTVYQQMRQLLTQNVFSVSLITKLEQLVN